MIITGRPLSTNEPNPRANCEEMLASSSAREEKKDEMLCHSIILANGESNNNYVGIKRQNNGNVCHVAILSACLCNF